MTLPFFYIPEDTGSHQLELDEETSRHIVQVLRMQTGEPLHLTNGSGLFMSCTIQAVHKKSCIVHIEKRSGIPPPSTPVSVAISLVKNSSRFEWFLEKATEIGVSEIIPMICERTEREKFRKDRMNAICISAMLQSRQCWLPLLREPQAFSTVIAESQPGNRYIAHCEAGQPRNSLTNFRNEGTTTRILIGPEGDFSSREIAAALAQGFISISLGDTRLRTETAGVVAAALLKAG